MITVLTGDVVGSQMLERENRAGIPEILREAAAFAGLHESFEVFGGDSLQAVCQPAHAAFTKAITLRARLLGQHGIDTRLSIGIGTVETLHPEKISLSQGEAFVLSGQPLQSMKQDQRIIAQASDSMPGASRHFLVGLSYLIDALCQGWTQKQALAVALATTEETQKELAKQFEPPVSAQAFGKHLASAQWDFLKQSLASIERAIEDAIKDSAAS